MAPELLTFNADVCNGCPEVEDDSIDISVFSPPYMVEDGYSDRLMLSLGEVLARVLKPGARLFMNFGQLKESFTRPFDAFNLLLRGGAGKLHPSQTFIWVKSLAIGGWTERGTCDEGHRVALQVPILQRGHYKPLQGSRIANYGFEYVFTATKGPAAKSDPLDRLAVGCAFSDKSNLRRGGRGKNGDLHCAGDVWFIPYSTTGRAKKKRHRHSYPVELPLKAIDIAGLGAGAWLFEPFLGGGITVDACMLRGVNCVGYDIDGASVSSLRRRIDTPAST